MVCLGRPGHFTFFKGCLPQILFGPFLNTLTHSFHYLKPKFLKNTLEVVHSQCRSFSRKIYLYLKNLPNGYFQYNYITTNFSNKYFSELLVLGAGRSINLSTKIKPSDSGRSKLLIGNYVFRNK